MSLRDALQVEIALSLLEGELAAELPAHMRAFARAHADSRAAPPAPLLVRVPSTLATARDALAHDELADRGLAILRLVMPIVIEDDPAVVAARAQPRSWPGLATLADARDAAARARFGCGAVELLHRLHGCATPSEPGEPVPPIDGWHVRGAVTDHVAIVDAWNAIANRIGVNGQLRIDPSKGAPPRAFVIEPKREVIIVVPEIVDTPAARFAVLHELGHAVVALALPGGTPRVLDEAAASYVARFAEPPSFLPPRWASELAVAARTRRRAVAAALADIERHLPLLPTIPGAAPPWALWHDPGAQAAYVDAEDVADRLVGELGPNPPRGQFLRALVAERARIDEAARL